jgi:hypothetical protein
LAARRQRTKVASNIPLSLKPVQKLEELVSFAKASSIRPFSQILHRRHLGQFCQ